MGEEEQFPPDPMADPMAPEMGMEDEMPYDEDEMAMAYYKAAKMTKSRMRKGFRNAAQVKSDEHDAPFGDKDSSVEGNEPQPAGDQGGTPEDETFGPGGTAHRAYAQGTYKALAKQVATLTKQLEALSSEGQVIAKAVVPAVTANGSREQEGQVILTRDMQEQAKKQSYKQLNALREEVGDLPRHGLIG